MPDPKVRFSPTDHREARKLGISLEDPLDGLNAATERLYNTLTTAYQRLDDECAHVHRAHRNVCLELEKAQAWVDRLVWLAVVVVGIAFGRWVIWR